jgi:hypothetical protein
MFGSNVQEEKEMAEEKKLSQRYIFSNKYFLLVCKIEKAE